MLYRLIKGTFKPGTGKVDGDSVRFAPDDPPLIFDLPRRWKRPYVRNSDGTIGLRYEGIDTLEEYQDPPKRKEDEEAEEKKKKRFAEKAMNKNLELLGTPDGKGEASGYILTKLIGSYGRLIAFVFTGCPPKKDGTFVSLDVEWMKKSINFRMIHKGYAYPSFYSTLADDLREAIKKEAAEAQSSERGIWLSDGTRGGVTFESSLSPDNPLRKVNPIFPKLWRRLEDYKGDERFST